MLRNLTEEELILEQVSPLSWQERLPYKWSDEMRVLGAIFDPMLTCRGHIKGLISRARIRHSIMTSLARSNWGLETGILRSAPSELLVSLTRLGIGTTGSNMYEGKFRQLDARRTNLAA